MSKGLRGSVRSLYQVDTDFIVQIDIKCYENPWTKVEFAKCTTAVFIEPQWPIGYISYQTAANSIQLMRLGVEPQFRRRGVATRLLAWLHDESRDVGIRRITTVIPESSEPALGLLRSQGYKAVNILKDKFEILGVKEDGYYLVRT